MAAILFLPFEIRTEIFLTSSLDRLVMNKIFFMTIFFIKRSRLAIQKPDFFVQFLNGPVFKCLVPGKMAHSNTRLVRYSVVHCIARIIHKFFKWVSYCVITSIFQQVTTRL
jgi:hypothetical protein